MSKRTTLESVLSLKILCCTIIESIGKWKKMSKCYLFFGWTPRSDILKQSKFLSVRDIVESSKILAVSVYLHIVDYRLIIVPVAHNSKLYLDLKASLAMRSNVSHTFYKPCQVALFFLSSNLTNWSFESVCFLWPSSKVHFLLSQT